MLFCFQSPDSTKDQEKTSPGINNLPQLKDKPSRDEKKTAPNSQTNENEDEKSSLELDITSLLKKKKKPSKLEVISEERKAFLEKDKKVQEGIQTRETKLQVLKEKSEKKDETLSAKEKELMALREKTRRMMMRAREKEKDFKNDEKEFKSVLERDPKEKQSMMDKIMAKANAKAIAMKEEMRKKRNQNNDDNLLAFLRSSHKKGGDIYEFIDENAQPELSSACMSENTPIAINAVENTLLPIPEASTERHLTVVRPGVVQNNRNETRNNRYDNQVQNGRPPPVLNGLNMHEQTRKAHQQYQEEKLRKGEEEKTVPPIIIENSHSHDKKCKKNNDSVHEIIDMKYIDDDDDNHMKENKYTPLSRLRKQNSVILPNKIELKRVNDILPRKSPSPRISRKSDCKTQKSEDTESKESSQQITNYYFLTHSIGV